MVKYELKKVFSRTSNRIALLLLAAIVAITCFWSMDVTYVDENGDIIKGLSAAASLKAMQKEWAGELNEEKIQQAIALNLQIAGSTEARSDDTRDNNIAYHRQQGIAGIRDLLNCAFTNGSREYDYYRADSLRVEDASAFYERRILRLKEILSDETQPAFSEAVKEYLIHQYETVSTPFTYDSVIGWAQLFDGASTIVMITMLILGYLVSGIFSNEFAWKSDAVFYASVYGRNQAVSAKIKAGLCIVTVTYFAAFFLYSAVLLFALGFDGWNCPVQIQRSSWKCFYHLAIWQKYLLIAFGGYIGCLFISFLSMMVSARTRSAVIAVLVPVVLIFIPSFLANIKHPAINQVINLLPDQLLQTGNALNNFVFYSVGENVSGAVPILFGLYTALTVVLLPVIYQEYRRKQIG